MKINYFAIDAFTDKVFGGNPAGVCMLDEWLADDVLQKIAIENNLSETAFMVHEANGYHIRWFSPTMEIDLCGHATLASAYVIFKYGYFKGSEIAFASKSGILKVAKKDEILQLNFPARPAIKAEAPAALLKGVNSPAQEVLKARDYLVVLPSEEAVKNCQPDFAELLKVDCLGICITAKGDTVDFVSRFFAPRAGIDEDPVTGSAHSTLIPYWAEKLNKKVMTARQVSKRGGALHCELAGDRVLIGGQAQTYMTGTIEI